MAARERSAWVLRRRPEGRLGPEHFDWVTSPLPALEDGEVQLRTVYLSVDPTNRIWASDMEQYMPPVAIGEVMRGGTLGVVEASRHPDFAEGDVVQGMWGWCDRHVAAGGAGLNKVPAGSGVPLDAYMSVLGATGMTAYFGLLDLADPRPGETVVVSAAAGAVGSIVGQIAKVKGCRAVGLAGSDAKCRHLVDELGFDAAINYKTEDLDAALGRCCPEGVDVYFENTGGPITDAVLKRVNLHARMPLCGLISVYNQSGPVHGPYNYEQVLMKRVKIQGFIVIDYLPRFPEGIEQMGRWVADGRIQYRTDIVEGLENAIEAVDRLFDGANLGKVLVRVSPEP